MANIAIVNGVWLVVDLPSSPIGMMMIPSIWKIKDVPNHQPDSNVVNLDFTTHHEVSCPDANWWALEY